MANVSFDKQPGFYDDPATVQLVLSSEVESVQYTVNAGAPSISKYVAYDTSTPPVPFIAVTQDGLGNVVYDGGFPKFYNNNAPAESVTTFAGLSASFKFLYNAINFIANPAKFAAGNRKILVLGDKSSGSYWIKGTAVASDFGLSFARLAAVANVQLTIKDTSDWPEGKLNPTLAELNQYAAVILMSSESALSSDRITEQAIDAMVLYREQGNGLMVITDHGPVLNTIEEAIPSRAGFFNTANRVITRFGCWFSGDYNRVPVNVGFLRANYGDHPLYNGMADSEDISAGGSESRVWVAQTPSYLPGQVPPFQIAKGRTTIQVAASLKDGSVEILRVYYYVLDFKVTFTGNGQAIADSSVFDAGIAHMVNVAAGISGLPSETVSGILYVNDARKGTVGYTTAGGSKLTWDSGVTGSFLVNDGDTFKVILTAPLNMTAMFTVKRFQPVLDTNYVPNALNTINSYAGQATPVRGLRKAMADLKALPEYSAVEFTPSLPRNLRALSTLFKR
jgi:hypothetical protein